MRKRARGGIIALITWVTVGALAACTEASFSLGGPLSLDFTTNTPVAVTDSILVEYDVVGQSLLGMVVRWGDAEVDSLLFAGAQTAGGRVFHSYAAAGSYMVTVRVEDSFEGAVTDSTLVTIEP